MAYSGTVYRSTYSERGRMDGDISGPAAYGSVLAYMFVLGGMERVQNRAVAGNRIP